jgi:3'-phosphoadenosine 5'-phosphosulfate sulfotransferase
MEKGFTYKWINLVNGKWYIGSHKGSIDDGYTASGVRIQAAFLKYGIDKFVREILYEGTAFREEEERLLVAYDAENNPQSYNLKNSAVGGGNTSTVIRERLSNYYKGKTYKEILGSEEAALAKKEKIRNANLARTYFPHTEETKAKIRAKRSLQSISHSVETKQKMSKAHLGMKHTDQAKEKMRQAKTDTPLSEAHRLSLRSKKGKQSAEHRANWYVSRYCKNLSDTDKELIYKEKINKYQNQN